jgi:hypothetical protein
MNTMCQAVWRKVRAPLSITLAAATLAACGGGGSGGGGDATPPASSALTGTAAIGAALANGTVQVTDRTGTSVCTNTQVTTDASGRYRCVLSATAQSPFVIVVTDPDGLVSPMISVLAAGPAPGTESVANVTPLTTAIVAQLVPGKDPFTLVGDPAAVAAIDATTLEAIKANVVSQLAAVLVDVGVDPATFDPITSVFTGGSGTGADKMLDQVRVTFDNGAPTLSNVLNPGAPAVPMANASTTSPPTVAASAVASTFDIRDLDIAKTELERCFALPAALRAPNPDTTNRRLTALAAECEGFAAEAGDPGVDIDFRNNGYDTAAYFYGLLTSSEMDGARFNLPELMRYITRPDGRDEAVLNLKFRTAAGFTGNRILTAKLFPGSRPGGSQWWLIGNQRPVDAFIRAAIRQREQTIPQALLDSNPAFNNAARNRFEVGLEIFVHRPNNGVTVANPNNPNNAVRYVRVKGPGLPVAGLMLADVAAGLPQTWMGILNATGGNPNEVVAPQQFATTSANIFRIQRTRGLTGADALTLRPNPGVGSAIPGFVDWAHPTMYGEAPDALWQFNLAQVPAWSLYEFEVFCDTATVPCHTFSTRITTPLLPAAYASTQQWHAFAPVSRAFVADGAPAVATAEIAWAPNSLAERVDSVNAYSFSPSGPVNSPSTVVPRGSFGITVPAIGGDFPAVSVSDSTRGRTLQLRHLMLDGSYKDHLIQFN